ncbi:hypothetical protein CEXT_529901 [Caerostris extrusa]|uniref:Uncharacterized protein n=1 Tax=Caerostris extrusa TaxID=172846 RepID=A0AAV4QQR1_CAEEX|nr:hypothetical protein CEXT_529901 [Caerostris extrusa]
MNKNFLYITDIYKIASPRLSPRPRGVGEAELFQLPDHMGLPEDRFQWRGGAAIPCPAASPLARIPLPMTRVGDQSITK